MGFFSSASNNMPCCGFFFFVSDSKTFSDKLSWKGFIKRSDTNNLVQNLMLSNIFCRNLLVKWYSALIRVSPNTFFKVFSTDCMEHLALLKTVKWEKGLQCSFFRKQKSSLGILKAYWKSLFLSQKWKN